MLLTLIDGPSPIAFPIKAVLFDVLSSTNGTAPSNCPFTRVTPVAELMALLALTVVWLVFGSNILTKLTAADPTLLLLSSVSKNITSVPPTLAVVPV